MMNRIKENHEKNKEQGVFKCFFVISLKYLTANWHTLIPFLLFLYKFDNYRLYKLILTLYKNKK